MTHSSDSLVPLPHRLLGLGLVAFSLLASRCTRLESASDFFPQAASAGGIAGANGPGVMGGTGNVGIGAGGMAQGLPIGGGNSVGGSVSGGASGGPNGLSGGAGANGTGGAANASCPPVPERVRVELGGPAGLDIAEDTTWTCRNLYVLMGQVFVRAGFTLRIEAGTVVQAAHPQAFLLSVRGGRIEAFGTEQAPILFTSGKVVGTRAAGDWRGLILIGGARTNQAPNSTVHDTVGDARAQYGGGPLGPGSGSCGILRYVRVEYAGGNIGDNALPAAGLTLAGCGSETIVENVHVHRSGDGIGLLGGTAPLRKVIVSGALDDGIEWVSGYTGSMQYVVVQMYGAFSTALTSNNSESNPSADPASEPTIFNATLVGNPQSPLTSDQETGVAFAFGGGGYLRNSVVLGFRKWASDVLGGESTALATSGKLDVSHSIFFGNSDPAFPGTADDLFDETAFFTDESRKNRFVDPQLVRPQDELAPDFSPMSSEVDQLPAQIPTDLDSLAVFRGALPVQVFGATDWTKGWTAFPRN
ncbi:MAG: hypothetical protein SFV15_08650 [Polyangiaceae bacterium]|nr:hypothetical protein [Polyangiaceae bacterium]